METFGFAVGQWNQAKQEARDAMIERAKVRGMLTYSELVAKIPTILLEPHDVRLFEMLRQVSVEEDAQNRGLLTVVVVHKHGDMQPGMGFFELAESLGRDTSDEMVCWVAELHKVHGHWSK